LFSLNFDISIQLHISYQQVAKMSEVGLLSLSVCLWYHLLEWELFKGIHRTPQKTLKDVKRKVFIEN